MIKQKKLLIILLSCDSFGLLLWVIKVPQRVESILLNDIPKDVFCAVSFPLSQSHTSAND